MISFPPLHRAPGAPLATYRQEFARDCAAFEEDPQASAEKFEKSLVTLTSLQSEGRYKREAGDGKQERCTLEEFQALDALLKSDHSTLPRLCYQNLAQDAESTAVLQEVRGELARQAGSADGFFFQPISLGFPDVHARAVRMQDGKVEAYNVSLHDTPGHDDGLLLVAPARLDEFKDIIQKARSTKGLDLDHIEAGWQYHQQAYKQ